MKNMATIDRFMLYVKKTRSCWLWLGALSHNGYGQFWFNYKNIRAHRWSFLFFIGKIPQGLLVLHKCNNPRCVNPRHLKIGSYKDNNHDTYLAGHNQEALPNARRALAKRWHDKKFRARMTTMLRRNARAQRKVFWQ